MSLHPEYGNATDIYDSCSELDGGDTGLIARIETHRVQRMGNWLDGLINPSLLRALDSKLYHAVKTWTINHVGFDPTTAIWVLTASLALNHVGGNLRNFLKKHACNSIALNPAQPETQELLRFVVEASWHLFSILDPETNDDQWELAPSAGTSWFIFDKKLFCIEQESTKKGGIDPYAKVRLRCFWGSSKPNFKLIDEMKESVSRQTHMLWVHTLGSDSHTPPQRLRKRPIDTIDLEPDTMEDILSDVRDHFAEDTKEFFIQNGAPYTRGYCFHGPPGTGKTSLAKAIAGESNVPLYIVKFDGMNDQKLETAFNQLPGKCVVLLEDVDAAGIGREGTTTRFNEAPQDDNHEEEDGDDVYGDNSIGFFTNSNSLFSGLSRSHLRKSPHRPKENRIKIGGRTSVTLSGLLNVLDGVSAKEGRLLIMTTNAIKSLDDALLRPGRVDRKFYLGYATKLTAAITFKRIFDRDTKCQFKEFEVERMAKQFGAKVPKNVFATCDIQGYCIKYRGKPDVALANFDKFIEDKKMGADEIQYDINDVRPEVQYDDAPEDGWDDQLKGWGTETESSKDTTLAPDQSSVEADDEDVSRSEYLSPPMVDATFGLHEAPRNPDFLRALSDIFKVLTVLNSIPA